MFIYEGTTFYYFVLLIGYINTGIAWW